VAALVLTNVWRGYTACGVAQGQAFNPAINDQCARDVQTRCEAHSLRTVMPSTSVPNWIAALTGVSPSMHGILGNIGVGRFPFDSIFAQARATHAPHALRPKICAALRTPSTAHAKGGTQGDTRRSRSDEASPRLVAIPRWPPWPFSAQTALSPSAQARTLGVDTGVSSSPWLVNLIKPHLPLLTGDGRVSSSADGVYETTMHASTETVDGRRRAATLYAARMNAGTVQNSERVRTHPGRYAFFVTQLTNVDSIGHRRCAMPCMSSHMPPVRVGVRVGVAVSMAASRAPSRSLARLTVR
jgi:hypothetical protein